MRDLSFAVRSLWKDKAFSVATFLTLALCIGANTALFGIVHSVLLKPLPVPQPDRLVFLHNSYPRAGAERGSSGVPDYFDRVVKMTTLDSLALYNTRNRATGESGRPERVLVMGVTPSYFRVARVQAERGRTFTEQEGELGHEDRVILSHAYWQERYAGDPGVVGRQLRLDGRPYTIVGVMGKEFLFMEPDARLWIPLAFTAEQKSDDNRHNNSWDSVGRLRDGATIAQAQAQVDLINAGDMDRFPAMKELLVNAGFRTIVLPLQDDLVRNVKSRLYLLWGGTLLVLLIGCVNVVNLALVRSHARLRDLVTRLALGAGRFAIVRHLLTESILLTFVSGLAGLMLGWGSLRLLGRLDLERIPRGAEIGLDLVTVTVTMGLAVLLGAVIGAFPIANTFGVNLSSVFHEGGRTGTAGRGPRLLRRALVVTQVAVAFVLLIGTGLLAASFRQILAIDPGFDPRQVLTASVRLPVERYKGDPELRAFADEAVRRVRAIPGVTHAGITSSIPLGDNHSDSVILAEGYQMKPGESILSPTRVEASAGYFEAMRIPLQHGRYFDGRDGAGSQHVIIVDTRLARRFWPNQNPVGRRMYRPSVAEDLLAATAKTDWLTVVGVVGEVKQDALVAAKAPVGAYYLPATQETIRAVTFAVRGAGDVKALSSPLRKTIAGLDPELPVFSIRTMEQVTDDSLVTRRWPVFLSMGFGVVALLLSAVGIYGVLAYLVTQRTKEIGIRMALGGTPRTVVDLVLREGVALLLVGFATGAIGLVALRRALETQLYGIQASDPGVLAIATLVLGSVAMLACAIPARRATRINPVLALNRD
ncbi:MAG TPA: ABC transporter permease [Vicinamibacterales bacterium]|jgi:predicted permease